MAAELDGGVVGRATAGPEPESLRPATARWARPSVRATGAGGGGALLRLVERHAAVAGSTMLRATVQSVPDSACWPAVNA